MITGRCWRDQRGELAIFGHEQGLSIASLILMRSRVPRPPAVSPHSVAALEAKAHALVEMAASFSPPAVGPHAYRPHTGVMPQLAGPEPF